MTNYINYITIRVEQIEGYNIFKGETIAMLTDGTWAKVHSMIWEGTENTPEWYTNTFTADVSKERIGGNIDKLAMMTEFMVKNCIK